ncbi:MULTISPECIES: cysteine desulfurase family protein [Enterococcus]|uniref:cysteine desulfurase n=2 Tax=Enterococcus durans TaxID=53345 RepID=A0A377L392_9ENTE|nr:MULTISPECIES: cysteine desulfurase family protein [Enterococcus]QCJ64843.1 cysteine desulfurase [Lactobacillus sp. Koumiss]HCB26983.1 cysteine desulfurase [Enterococcus sp.]EMS75148.1 class V aminotransferase [Enterococcus durans IPLA 655]EOT34398.1 cysteine desulfurase [Enterococcus durans ATCC 6056]EOU25822.1 cysteine desulfurase [Enterococcus durans ATCC 6056]
MEKIYLDHAATTPMHPQVITEMTMIMQETFGNPSSIHGFGRLAHEKLETARQIIADTLQVNDHEIIFNSGGTEGDNTAILETAFSRKAEGKHLITTAIEHPAVLNAMKYLETKGFEVTYLPVDEKGNISLEDFEQALREDTILVSIMYGNNEIGNLMPIKEIGERLREHPAYFHTDAVQAYGNQTIHPKDLGIDLLSVSAHKINGPKGVGFLYKKDGVNIPAMLLGGEQEEKRRAGTENLAGIWGMAKAAELLTVEEREARSEKYAGFQQMILEELEKQGIDVQVNGDLENKLPHVLNLRLPGVVNDLLLMKLDLNGIAISTGSACTAGNIEPSHVLEAMYGKDTPILKESIRISFGYGNTKEDIQKFIQQLVGAIK